jgi:hypothetical protein
MVLAPALALAAPTAPPPAPQTAIGEVKVVNETPGSRTIVDSTGKTHQVMKKITPAERKAAAERARKTREAKAKASEGAAAPKQEVGK